LKAAREVKRTMIKTVQIHLRCFAVTGVILDIIYLARDKKCLGEKQVVFL